MTTPKTPKATVTVPMIICPTTHNDWDWQVTFEDYYSTGTSTGQPVSNILGSVVSNFTSGDSTFRFSYAEVGFLRRFLNDNPTAAEVLQAAGPKFCLLGGGITSPDNQTCHGEVFIRNYLTGHEYLRSVGLIDNVCHVAWLPDDFGHDPQLPVMIEAMGMSSIGLSRIPGSPQPAPCASQEQAADVRASGLSFYWPGNDGSKVLTHFMPQTYYGITNGLSQSAMSSDILSGVQAFLDGNYDGVVWPGGTIFATEGGDWQLPSSATPGNGYGVYEWSNLDGARVSSRSGDVTAVCQLGTFADYLQSLAQARDAVKPSVLHAENYWTGYFASRPQLKIDHYQAAQRLIGAEVLGSILTVRAGTTAVEQAELTSAIAAGWTLLVPTSHHDYITGTSPDGVYVVKDPDGIGWDSRGQLRMSAEAAKLSDLALRLSLRQLTESVQSHPGPTEIPVVVFNQTGSDLPDTAIVEMEDPSAGRTDFVVRVETSTGPVQRAADGKLLFQVRGLRSMSYLVVYLVPLGTVTPPMRPESAPAECVLSNDGTVRLVISQAASWAITRLEIGGHNYVKDDGTYANQLSIWSDLGNLYQFGMEYLSAGYCTQRTFGPPTVLLPEDATIVEKGPIRWRFVGQLTGSGNTYRTQYDLIRGETLVRITTTGAAPAGSSSQGWSVLTSFSMQTAGGVTASELEYGTSYFWENRAPMYPWNGLTFRASRDFAQLTTGSEAVAAVYHNGIPAWTIDGSILRGCLLRNAPGTQRGASGTDTDPHTQTYTLDVMGQLAVTGTPLRTALYAQTPLAAAPVAAGSSGKMPPSAQLASVAQSDAVIRVGKTNPPAGSDSRDLILRIQQARTGAQRLDVDLPFLASGGLIVHPSIVTALETTPADPPVVSLNGTTASFLANRALWTMRVPVTPPDTR